MGQLFREIIAPMLGAALSGGMGGGGGGLPFAPMLGFGRFGGMGRRGMWPYYHPNFGWRLMNRHPGGMWQPHPGAPGAPGTAGRDWARERYGGGTGHPPGSIGDQWTRFHGGGDSGGGAAPDTSGGAAKTYLSTLNRSGGGPTEISGLNNQFANRAAGALQAANNAGMNLTIASGSRPNRPQNRFDAQGRSMHDYGLAIDVSGLGTRGSPNWEAIRRFAPIARRFGLYNPYIHDPMAMLTEFNHWQASPDILSGGNIAAQVARFVASLGGDGGGDETADNAPPRRRRQPDSVDSQPADIQIGGLSGTQTGDVAYLNPANDTAATNYAGY